MSVRTAKQLIDAAAACVVCGKEHKPWQKAPNQQSWASKADGHPYRARIHELTNNSAGPILAALRKLADSA